MKILLLDAYNLIYRARSGFTRGDFPVVYNFFRSLRPLIEKFDPDRGAKFTSYLYQQLSFAFKNELKKKKQMWYRDNTQIDSVNSNDSYDSHIEFRDTISGLPEDVSTILQQRFLGNMTMVEIAKANGYSRETARRRLQTAIKICKKSNGKFS